jgi:hypothetical protein
MARHTKTAGTTIHEKYTTLVKQKIGEKRSPEKDGNSHELHETRIYTTSWLENSNVSYTQKRRDPTLSLQADAYRRHGLFPVESHPQD